MKDTQQKNSYDLTVMLSDREDVDLVESIIEKEGAEDIKEQSQKIDFAYEISGFTEGYMSIFKFDMESELTQNLTKKLNSEPKVLRHLLLNDIVKENNQKEAGEKKSPQKRTQKKKSNDEDHLTNEAIEQKIEEISN